MSQFKTRTLSHAGVALPLDLCHFPGDDFDIKRTEFPNTALLAFKRNAVAAGRERNLKSALGVSGKFGCPFALVVFDQPDGIGERFRERLVRFDRPGVSRIDRNHSFYPRLRVRLRLAL